MESSSTTTSRLCSTRRFGFFQNHFGDLDVALRRLVKRRADHFALDGALHVRHFFRALVDEQARSARPRDDWWRWHWPWTAGIMGLSGSRRSVDQAALALADRTKQIQHAAVKFPCRSIFTSGPEDRAASRLSKKILLRATSGSSKLTASTLISAK